MFHPVMLVLIAIHFVSSVLFAWAIGQKYKRYVNEKGKNNVRNSRVDG